MQAPVVLPYVALVAAYHLGAKVALVAADASNDGVLTRVIRELDGAEVRVDDIGFRRPTLDEVFLALTGRPAEEVTTTEEVPA